MPGWQPYEIPCGLGTLNGSRSPRLIQDGDLLISETLTYEHDTWQKAGGRLPINTTPISGSPSVIWLWDFFASSTSIQELVAATSDGNLITVGTGGIVKTLQTGLGTNKMTVGAEGASGTTKGLYIVNGNAEMQLYTGGLTAAAIANPAADWASNKPTWVFAHKNRMFAGGNNNDRHRAYGSLTTDHGDYASVGAISLNIFPGEGEGLMGGISWRGRAYFFKYPRGIYYLIDTDASTANWYLSKLSDSVGLASPAGIVQIEDDGLFLSTDNFVHALSAVTEFGDAVASAILPMQIGPFIRENMNQGRAGRVQARYDGLKRKAYFALSGLGSQVNNELLWLDMHQRDNPQYGFSSRDTCEALGMRRDPVSMLLYPILGNDSGTVSRIDTDARNNDSAAYTGRYRTKEIELLPRGLARANLAEIEVNFVPQGNYNLNLDVYRDGVLSQTVTFEQSGVGGVLGSFVLGTDALGTETVANKRKAITGDCRRIMLEGYNENADENFSVVSHIVKFTPGNDR